MSDQPKDFDEVIKPSDQPTRQIDTSKDNPATSAQTQAFLAGRTKEWDRFLGQINDNYIQILRDYAPKNEFILEVGGENKTYQRKKIRAREYSALEKMRGQLLKEKDTEKTAGIQMDIYEKCAAAYLGMSKEDFENADYEELKKICDSCNFRTLHGLPN